MSITNILRKIIMHVCLILSLGLHAVDSLGQNNQEADTLTLVENYASNKEFDPALNLLKIYKSSHSPNNRITQLELKITYWNNASENLNGNYKNAITKFPDYLPLQLDYAIYLYEQDQSSEAYILLKEYCKKDSVNLEAKYILGMIYYSMGDMQPALKYMNEVLSKEPSHKNALKAYNELILITSPYMNLQANYYSDHQPITKLSTIVEYGVYKSKFASPFVRAQLQGIKDQSNYIGMEIGNNIQFPKQFYATAQVGIAKLPEQENNIVFTYDVLCKKNIGQHVSIQAGIYSKPYLYTYSSLSTVVKPTTFTTSFNWGKTYSPFERSNDAFINLQNWTLNSGYLNQQYQDNNSTTTLYAWILSPNISWNNFQFRLGYSYSYSNSKEVRYTPIQSMSQIESNWNLYTPIQGYYNPYFTPINQQISAVITQINYLISSRWFVNYKSTIGFYAHGDAPYIYIDNVNNKLTFAEGLSSQRYTPFDIQLSTGIKISNKATCYASYNYTRAFFFDSQQIQLGLKYIFTND